MSFDSPTALYACGGIEGRVVSEAGTGVERC